MIARTPIYEVVAIKKKTKTRIIENVKVGDRFVIEVPIKYPGRSHNGLYASKFTFRNLNTGDVGFFMFGEFDRIEAILDWKEIDNG
jgi:hypothetical protein